MEARKSQQIIGNVSDATLKNIVKHGTITNCAVTLEDIRIANDIFGPNIKSVIGKTTNGASKVSNALPMSVPSEILKKNSDLIVAVDILYVNEVPFLAAVSNPVDYITSHSLHDVSEKSLKQSIDRMLNLYKTRGFNVTRLDADGQFECLEKHRGHLMNICAQRKHVPVIERKSG